MEKKHWFVPKNYGWGLMPVSWEGGIVTLFFVVLLLAYAEYGYGLFTANVEMAVADYVRYVFDVAVSVFIFMFAAKGRTKGEVRCYWGNRPK